MCAFLYFIFFKESELDKLSCDDDDEEDEDEDAGEREGGW